MPSNAIKYNFQRDVYRRYLRHEYRHNSDLFWQVVKLSVAVAVASFILWQNFATSSTAPSPAVSHLIAVLISAFLVSFVAGRTVLPWWRVQRTDRQIFGPNELRIESDKLIHHSPVGETCWHLAAVETVETVPRHGIAKIQFRPGMALALPLNAEITEFLATLALSKSAADRAPVPQQPPDSGGLTFKVTDAEIQEMVSAHLGSGKSQLILYAAVVVLFGAAFAVGRSAGTSNTKVVFVTACGLAFMVTVTILIRRFHFRRSVRQLREHYADPLTITATVAGIQTRSALGEAHLPWTQFTRVHEGPLAYLIELTTGQVLILPKRVLMEEGHTTSDLLRQHWVSRI